MMDVAEGRNGSLVCQILKVHKTSGMFYGHSPFEFETPILLAQVSLASLVTGILHYILSPLGETSFISQMLGGVIVGPAGIGKNTRFTKMFFPLKSYYVSETFALFGCMLFLFLVGAKMDITLVRKSGKKAVVIGLCTFFVPLILSTAFARILSSYITLDPSVQKHLVFVAFFQSQTSFYVIACALADLKILNSELGRLAISSSLISGICSWSFALITFAAKESLQSERGSLMWMALCVGCMVAVIAFILRPIMFWMAAQTGEGEAIKEGYILIIFMMVLGSAFFAEIFGQHFLFGPMILGVAVPEGPPLGSALIGKLDSFVSSILLPIYFAVSCTRINLSVVNLSTFGIVEVLALVTFIGKLMGTMLPSLYCKMPFNDALSLGLIMNIQGITDILIYKHALMLSLVDEDIYCSMIISMVLITGTITPIAKVLYKPSKRFRAYKRRTIQHTRPDSELRLLACIYHEHNTPSIIELLDLTNPTAQTPICFYIVHLTELAGRSSPLLVPHQPSKKKHTSQHHSKSDHIINAFRLYEKQLEGAVLMNPFTSIAPYVTMHEDVCALALDKRTSMVIVPFHRHRQWTIQGNQETENSLRVVNHNIIRKSPCSVGILIDRGTLRGNNSHLLASKPSYSIGMIFSGGQDDREALAYAMRMSEHRNVAVTVIRFLENDQKSKCNSDKDLDSEMTNEYRLICKINRRHVYKEEVVNDSAEMVSAIRCIENLYDLLLVGLRHPHDSRFLEGLSRWNEFPELGFIGDLLAASDSTCKVSILVVRQQTFAGDELLHSPKYIKGHSCTVLDIP